LGFISRGCGFFDISSLLRYIDFYYTCKVQCTKSKDFGIFTILCKPSKRIFFKLHITNRPQGVVVHEARQTTLMDANRLIAAI
jgi:hypothetical protein